MMKIMYEAPIEYIYDNAKPSDLEQLSNTAQEPIANLNDIVIMTGVTGSGKTSHLASVFRHVYKEQQREIIEQEQKQLDDIVNGTQDNDLNTI